MRERSPRRTRSFVVATLGALAIVVSGCVAAPGASNTLGSSAPASAQPGGTPSPTSGPSDTAAPSPTPSASASASVTPSGGGGCGIATYPTGANDLVLRLTVAGGFVPPGVDITNVPLISVYGDGRVISPGPQIMIYPGPLLPSLQVQVLTEAGMRRLLRAAADAGLLVADITYEAHGIADAPTSFFTLVADGCTHHVNAYALAESISNQGLDQATIEARARLLQFSSALTDLRTIAGAENVRDAGLYRAIAYRIVSREDPAAGPGASATPEPALVWPLATPLATFGEPLVQGMTDTRCGVADGTDAAALTPLFEGANAETHWTSGGRQYYLRVRPLLPDESGCGRDPA